ncbi:MAG: hypothetical protein ABR961_12295 [Thermoanaerobaculaceae bacterium]
MGDDGVPPPHRPRPGFEAEVVSPDPGPRTPAPVSAGEPPPFGASWNALYGIVAGTLAALIALFALFTRAFE